MTYTDYLPNNVGTYLTPSAKKVDLGLAGDYVVCIDGLAGSGKSTLGISLSLSLNIPHISSGIFYRVFTYILEKYQLEFTPISIESIARGINFKVDKMEFTIYYKNSQIPLNDLRNKELDGALNRYSKDIFFRKEISKMLVTMVQSIKTSFILDLRGSSPDYVKVLEQEGRQVIRLLLVTDLETKVYRRALEYGKTLGRELKEEEVGKIRKDIICRDSQDVESIIKTGIGLIHPNTGIIDSSNLSAQQVSEIALCFIAKSIKPLTSLEIK
jgi:cytidylate kinase